MFSQYKIWVNLVQKVLAEYIKVVAHHMREALIGISDQFIMELISGENKINKIHQHETEPICSAIAKI